MSTARHLGNRIKSVAALGRSVIGPLFGGQMTLFSTGLGGLVIAGAIFAAAPASVAPERLLGNIHTVKPGEPH